MLCDMLPTTHPAATQNPVCSVASKHPCASPDNLCTILTPFPTHRASSSALPEDAAADVSSGAAYDPAELTKGAPSRHLWLGNLHQRLPRSLLRSTFEKFGPVEDVVTFPGRMYAFVNFREPADAAKAAQAVQVSLLLLQQGTPHMPRAPRTLTASVCYLLREPRACAVHPSVLSAPGVSHFSLSLAWFVILC